jgi:hypothetical protein
MIYLVIAAVLAFLFLFGPGIVGILADIERDRQRRRRRGW